MSGTTRVLLHGAPGCGKTYQILERVQMHHEEDGIDPEDIYLVNFTRNGRNDTADDLVERHYEEDLFPNPDPEAINDDDWEQTLRDRCRTLHQIALKRATDAGYVENPKEQVITMDDDEEWYEEFCQRQGLSFTTEETNPFQLLTEGRTEDPAGNKLFAINEWLCSQYLPTVDRRSVERIHKCIQQTETDIPHLSKSRMADLLDKWDEFKKGRGGGGRKFEHHDYVDICLEHSLTPDVDLLAVDEFQDLCPVEYALYKMWAEEGDLKWAYISGDVNQAIYGFRGATPYYLANTPVDETHYLTESRRCPKAVADVASGILEQVPAIKQNIFRPHESHDTEGTAAVKSVPNGDALADLVRDALDNHDDPDGEDTATVYLLTRTNWQLATVAKDLQQAGLPFDTIGEKGVNPWPDRAVDCLLALRAIRRGTPVPVEQAETLIDTASNSDRRLAKLSQFDPADGAGGYDVRGDEAVYEPERVEAAFDGHDTAQSIVDVLEMPDFKRDMLRGALSTDADPDPSRVQLGTIHETKGLEAPCVMLFTNTTKSLKDRFQNGSETERAEEARVAYVGATRASETLYLCSGFFDGPTHPLFADGLPGVSGNTHGDATVADSEGVAD